MKKLMLAGMLVLLIVGGFSSLPSTFNDATTYARYCGDGWIDWSGRDSDYLCAGYGYIYTFRTGSGRFIIALDVPWGADFDLYLVKDTDWPWGRFDRGDTLVDYSRRGGSSNEYINSCVWGGTYFVIVAADRGCGWYDLSIKWDG